MDDRQEVGGAALERLLRRHQLDSGTMAAPDSFFRVVLDSLCEGVVITDLEDRIVFANRPFEELTGYGREELIGATAYKVLCAPESWEAMVERNRSRTEGAREVYELEHFRKDGSRQWVTVRATPLRDGQGEIVGTIGAVSSVDVKKSLEQRTAYLEEEISGEFNGCEILGQSAVMQKVLQQVQLVAPTDATVLVLGESGTGKELVARAIHQLSGRSGKPLVRVNCASVPRELFESEFFGHVKGAFTGAVRDRVGRFELAHGGTLFLDEVGEIPPESQSKLLRVLQEGQFERVGEERTRGVDVRVIAATNRDLLAHDRAGLPGSAHPGWFRPDLYYRLSVFNIDLPALRERREDIPLLIRHFVRRSADRLKLPVPRISPLVLKELGSYDWPGNVRELQNVIERGVLVSQGGQMRVEVGAGGPSGLRARGVPESSRSFLPEDLELDDLPRLEKQILLRALERCRWKIYGEEGAAALLGIQPTTLASKMKKHGLSRPVRSRGLVIGVDD